jgi:hypothetical protein
MDQGYVLVADRLAQFVKDFPNGRIVTTLDHVSYDPAVAVGFVVVRAEVFKAQGATVADGTGLSSMPIPGLTNFTRGSEVENTETSAIGRALAAIGYLAKNPDGTSRYSSDDEIAMKKSGAEDKVQPKDPGAAATRPQLNRMYALAKEAGIETHTAEGKKVLQAIVLAATGKRQKADLTMADMDAIYKALENPATEAEDEDGKE